MVKQKDASHPLPQPTEAELQILNALWSLGPCTVRQVHEAMAESHPTGYTTVLKLLQIMHGKGLVQRDDSARAHIYRPAVSRDETQQRLTQDLVRRAYGGSTSELVMRALGGSPPASKEELNAIRALLDRMEDEA